MGFPEDTTTGNNRFNAALNSALRHLWSDMPDVLLTEEFRFVTEPPFDGGTLRPFYGQDSGGQAGVHDMLVMVRNESGVEISGQYETPEELRGRWLEIYDGTNYHYRKIRDHYNLTHTPHGGSSIANADHFVIDRPWHDTSASGTNVALKYRILTLEYPYPADVQKITKLMYSPDNSGLTKTVPMLRGDHDQWRRGVGLRATGNPEAWARGDFYQEPAPRYTPTAELMSEGGSIYEVDSNTAVPASEAWGFDSSGVEHGIASAITVQPKYEAAGTFSYKVVHVWGRRKQSGAAFESVGGNVDWFHAGPWYISAASAASEQISTTWGGSAIVVRTPNVDFTHGYNTDTSKPSYHRYGVEKWIFRARHDNDPTMPKVQSANATIGPQVVRGQDDGVYYLWAISTGHKPYIVDRGEYSPDKSMPLEAWHGHQSIRFDRLPSSTDTVLLQAVKRPPQLHHDHDAPRVPEECLDALFALVASYLAGDRDGSLERKQFYLAEFEEHKRRLIRLLGIETAMVPEFGDGLGLSGGGRWESAGQTVKEG